MARRMHPWLVTILVGLGGAGLLIRWAWPLTSSPGIALQGSGWGLPALVGVVIGLVTGGVAGWLAAVSRPWAAWVVIPTGSVPALALADLMSGPNPSVDHVSATTLYTFAPGFLLWILFILATALAMLAVLAAGRARRRCFVWN
jgi:hypothetical protein